MFDSRVSQRGAGLPSRCLFSGGNSTRQRLTALERLEGNATLIAKVESELPAWVVAASVDALDALFSYVWNVGTGGFGSRRTHNYRRPDICQFLS
ncbi:hypothetical protein VMCG_05457 [Cytospora schulzeri]|uniref:Uncharacterized protein n=1 Tax=Cytospora schulzeri TaxID=448051 RepID=A0A423WK99_9PEZI|nr:hypothetical protein VMCG_05457 [Valsa malicola]